MRERGGDEGHLCFLPTECGRFTLLLKATPLEVVIFKRLYLKG
jgi:hypothetical protein